MSENEEDGVDYTDAKPTGERWAPLGANALDETSSPDRSPFHSPEDSPLQNNKRLLYEAKIRDIEEQQENLSSLITHFAQVQFRIEQIVEAPPGEEKERLLEDLKAFAFRGVPDMQDKNVKKFLSYLNGHDLRNKVLAQRAKQKELINQLKAHLEDLEKYAYETGGAGLPQSAIMERQKVIIDQLKGKLNLNVDDISKHTVDDLKTLVDHAISQLVNPLKMKETLLKQLKTQVTDLERFIEFLQGEVSPDISMIPKSCKCTCKCPVHGPSKLASQSRTSEASRNGDEIREETISLMKRAAALLQMFAAVQFGCGSEQFRKNSLKRTMKGNHWGDLRARLEIAVAHVLEIVSHPSNQLDTDYASDSDHGHVLLCNATLTSAVRKKLAISIRDLLQHGLMPVGQSASVVPFIGCLPQIAQTSEDEMHAWELILKYYKMKNGEKYNSTPARKLSQSYNLDIVGGTAISNKQVLLSVIGNIIVTHAKYKRSYDSHLKAFICAALNYQKLVKWLRLILRTKQLIDMYYQPWSYVVQTDFEDSLNSLDRLTPFKFELPVDLAVRQLQNIKDAF